MSISEGQSQRKGQYIEGEKKSEDRRQRRGERKCDV